MKCSGYVSIVSLDGFVCASLLVSWQRDPDAFDDAFCFDEWSRGIFSEVRVARLPHGVGATASPAFFNGNVKWVLLISTERT